MSEERKIYLSVVDREWLRRKRDLENKLARGLGMLDGDASEALIAGAIKDGLLTEDEAVAWRGKCIGVFRSTETYYRNVYNNPEKASVMVFEHPNKSWVPGWGWLAVAAIVMVVLFVCLCK